MAQSGDEPPKSKKSESPPLPKRSKTLPGPGADHPHFPGPLFPAMRRNATLPPPQHQHQLRLPDLRIYTGNNNNNDDDAAAAANLNNRDWFYPSFMVPLAPKRGGPAPFDSRVGPAAHGKVAVDKPQRIAASEAKPEVEKKKVNVVASRPPSSISSARDSIRLKASRLLKPKFLVSPYIFVLCLC